MWVSAPLVFCFISHWWKEKMLYPNYLLLTSEFEACSTVLLWLQGLTSSRLAIDLGGTGSGPSPMPPVRSMLRADSQVQMDLQERKPPRAFSMTTHTGAAQKHRTSSMTGSPALGGRPCWLCSARWTADQTLPHSIGSLHCLTSFFQCCSQDPNPSTLAFIF